MSTRERVAYLNLAGWRRIGSSGAQSWRAPDPEDRTWYTLAAAVHAQRTIDAWPTP